VDDAILAPSAGTVVFPAASPVVSCQQRPVAKRVERGHARCGHEEYGTARRAVASVWASTRIVTACEEVDDAAAAAPTPNTDRGFIDEHQGQSFLGAV
jgi:hypothetical protein